jgi:hypothetical protein
MKTQGRGYWRGDTWVTSAHDDKCAKKLPSASGFARRPLLEVSLPAQHVR